MDSTALLDSSRGDYKGDTRTAIVVCGMHRSGTSALARVISLLGARLPKHLYPPGLGNETGHWEPEAAITLNDDMLRSAGTDVNALWDTDSDWLSSPVARGFVGKAKRLLDDEYDDEPLLVLKDPRVSLFMPVWSAALDELGIAPRIIICFRHPIEVAQSLAARQTTVFPYEAWDLDRGGLLWLRYILAAERHSRQSSRAFCDYADLLTDWRGTMQRLSTVLDVAWPRWSPFVENEVDSFLQADLRHQHAPRVSSRGGAWQDLIYPLYDSLRNQSEPSSSLFDSVALEYRKAVRIFGRHLAELNTKNAQLGSALPAEPVDALTSERDAALVRAAEAEREAGKARAQAESLHEATIARDAALVRAAEAEREAGKARAQAERLHEAAIARAEQAENGARWAEYERDNICQQRDEAREMLRRFTDERIKFANRAGRERDVAIKAEERTRAEVIMWQERAANLEAEVALWRSRYEVLRRRLLAILRWFGVVSVASRLPVRLRRSAAATLFRLTPAD